MIFRSNTWLGTACAVKNNKKIIIISMRNVISLVMSFTKSEACRSRLLFSESSPQKKKKKKKKKKGVIFDCENGNARAIVI